MPPGTEQTAAPAAVAKTIIKPYKLKASGDTLTRDDVTTWREVLLSYMRQTDTWTKTPLLTSSRVCQHSLPPWVWRNY